jgi:hypothetical protein
MQISVFDRVQAATLVASVFAIVLFLTAISLSFDPNRLFSQIFGIALTALVIGSEFKSSKGWIDSIGFLAPLWGKAVAFCAIGLLLFNPDRTFLIIGALFFWILTGFYIALHLSFFGLAPEPIGRCGESGEVKQGEAVGQ